MNMQLTQFCICPWKQSLWFFVSCCLLYDSQDIKIQLVTLFLSQFPFSFSLNSSLTTSPLLLQAPLPPQVWHTFQVVDFFCCSSVCTFPLQQHKAFPLCLILVPPVSKVSAVFPFTSFSVEFGGLKCRAGVWSGLFPMSTSLVSIQYFLKL